MILNNYKSYIWKKKFYRIIGDKKSLLNSNNEVLFVLGYPRSGTRWLINILSKSFSQLRIISEPLHPFKIKIEMQNSYDRVYIPFHKKIHDDNPIILVYKLLSNPLISPIDFLPSDRVLRNDVNPTKTIFKEVHCLLASESIINKFHSLAIVITRNPNYVVDSQINLSGINAVGGIHERHHLMHNKKNVLSNYFPDNYKSIQNEYKRLSLIYNKLKHESLLRILTVAIINKILYRISLKYSNVYHIKYEEIVLNPLDTYKRICNFFNIGCGDEMINFIIKSMEYKEKNEDPHSIFRDSKKQLNKKFNHLNDDLINEANNILNTLNLNI